MSRPIEQPARRYPADIHEEAERIARAERAAQRAGASAVTITHIDIPFEDVLAFAFKFVVAQVIIGLPFVFVLWLLLR